MKSRYSAATILFLMLAFFARIAQAGAMHVDCRDPIAYPDAAVNVVFLPLATATADNPSGYFTELSLLMQLDTLLHIVPYRSVGAVQLDAPDAPTNECTPQEVMRKLFMKNQVRPGNGLILVSGMLYREGEDYYIKTFVSFQLRDKPDKLDFSMDGLVLSARPSAQSVAFQPRHLTRPQLDRLEIAYQKANVIRPVPSLDAAGTPLPGPSANCIQTRCPSDNPRYMVTDIQGDWFKVRYFERGGTEGWLFAGTQIGEDHMENVMPELYFIQGLVGYLMTRAGSGRQEEIFPILSRQFAAYIKYEQDDDDNLALAYQLQGISKTAAGQAGAVDGISDFDKAITLDPANADLRNLRACAYIWSTWQAARNPATATGMDGKATIQALQAAMSLSPDAQMATNNLRTFYTAVQKGGLVKTGLSAEDVEKGLRQLPPYWKFY